MLLVWMTLKMVLSLLIVHILCVWTNPWGEVFRTLEILRRPYFYQNRLIFFDLLMKHSKNIIEHQTDSQDEHHQGEFPPKRLLIDRESRYGKIWAKKVAYFWHVKTIPSSSYLIYTFVQLVSCIRSKTNSCTAI